MDGRTDGPTDCFTFLANAVGNKKRELDGCTLNFTEMS